MSVKSAFGKNLKLYRKEKKLSQEQLSEKAGISVKHLSAIERGLTFVSAELLEKLSNSLEIPIFLLFIKDTEIFYSDFTLNTIDRIIEKRLVRAIEDIKLDIRQTKKDEGRAGSGE
jgi:transcriptional regulator with XRE-family HTH domain